MNFEGDKLIYYLDKYIKNLYEPIADTAIIPTLFMTDEAVKQGFKVVLTGDGADEIFGYKRYKIASNFSLFALTSKLSSPLNKLFGSSFLKEQKRFLNILSFSKSLKKL